MGNFSRDTFERLKHYVSVRLQQGVPLVDADWNEMEDIRRFELRAFLKWFVGDGVPLGDEGFHILSIAGTNNDFTIGRGRCLVDGWDAINDADVDVRYTEQELLKHPELAQRWNVAALAPLDVPTGERTDLVYLDVWEREVNSDEDGDLKNPNINIETCVRLKREWVVRVLKNWNEPEVPEERTVDNQVQKVKWEGHAYYPLALLERKVGKITDLRRTGLHVPSEHDIQQMATDAFGASYKLEHDGRRRLKISLREAINALINALICGELPPATPEMAIAAAPDKNDSFKRSVATQGDSMVIAWTTNRFAGVNQIAAARLDLANPAVGFGAVQQITDGMEHSHCHAVPLCNGKVLVVYESTPVKSSERIRAKCAEPSLLSVVASEMDVVTDGTPRERQPFAVPVGSASSEQAVVMWYEQATYTWQFSRFDTGAFAAKINLSPKTTTEIDLHAAKDSQDTIWAAFQVRETGGTNEIQVVKISPGLATSPSEETTLSTAATDKQPFVLVDRDGLPWVFWVSGEADSSIMYSRRNAAGAWSEPTRASYQVAGCTSNSPVAVVDADGAIWVFWDSYVAGGNKDIWHARLNPISGVWTGSKPITGTADLDETAFALTTGDGVIWLFWNRNPSGKSDKGELFFRRLITTV